jgi:hypothetical protein
MVPATPALPQLLCQQQLLLLQFLQRPRLIVLALGTTAVQGLAAA